MANNNLFSDFEAVSSKQWKQQIQYELKGADYNETLVWESPEGIKVKPFYHNDDSEVSEEVNLDAIVPTKPFAIVQNIFVHDVKKSNAGFEFELVDSLKYPETILEAECVFV